MSTEALTIDILNQDCLGHILDNLKTVQDLSTQRQVSPAFAAVADKLLLTFRSLKLFPDAGRLHAFLNELVTHNLLDEPRFQIDAIGSDVYVGHYDSTLGRQSFPLWMPHVMTNVVDLVLVLKTGDNHDLEELLSPWASTLESLTLIGNSAGHEPLPVTVIRGMTRLRRLDLFNFDLSQINPSRIVPVLRRLKHFGLYNYIEPVGAVSKDGPPLPDRIMPFLLALTPGVCHSLALSRITWPRTSVVTFIQRHEPLLASLTHLLFSTKEAGTLEYSGLSYSAMALLIGYCPKLVSLQFAIKQDIHIVHLFQFLAVLTCLTNLKIYFYHPLVFYFMNSEPMDSLPQLRRLSFFFPSTPHENYLQEIATLCPLLEHLTILTSGRSALPDLTTLSIPDTNRAPIPVQSIPISSLEASFLPSRFLDAIMAFQEGAIERELYRLCFPSQGRLFGPKPAHPNIDVLPFETTLQEHASSLDLHEFRRLEHARSLEEVKDEPNLDLSKFLVDLVKNELSHVQQHFERTICDIILDYALNYDALYDSLGKVIILQDPLSTGRRRPRRRYISRRYLSFTDLAAFVHFIDIHSPKCPLTGPVTYTRAHVLQCFLRHYRFDWPAFRRWLTRELETFHTLFEGSFRRFANSYQRNRVDSLSRVCSQMDDSQLAVEEGRFPRLEKLTIQSWRSYLATGRATNWLHQLMERMLATIQMKPRLKKQYHWGWGVTTRYISGKLLASRPAKKRQFKRYSNVN